jgi:isoquinoline 1-oxidoreductase subunit beta
VQQTNFNNFEITRMNEMPLVGVVLVPSAEKPGGIGEPGTALIGPAVANAVFTRTGKRVRTLPITAEELKRA